MRDISQLFPTTMVGAVLCLDLKSMSDNQVLAAYQQWAEQDYDPDRARLDTWELARIRQEMGDRGISL